MMQTVQRKAPPNPVAAAVPRAAAANRPAPAKRPGTREVNTARESAVAVVVPEGKGVAAGHVVAVAAGASFEPPAGFALAGFLHADGSAVKFAGRAGAVYLDREEARGEFGALCDGAVPNKTGLPDGLKAGVESLSGLSMDGVKVHYNSSRPAGLGALAYTQGHDIHVAPGQEQHLPHEAWHVVQQAQGRVRPTVQRKGGTAINDDAGLEREADAMGARSRFAGVGIENAGPILDTGIGLHPAGGPVQLKYATVADILDPKYKPSANFADSDILEIANWCLGRGTNSMRAAIPNDYQHAYQVIANNKSYSFDFNWSLAIHVDFGGSPHGGVDTPHLQVVQSLLGMPGSTKAILNYTRDLDPSITIPNGLAFNSSDNAVALSMAEAQQCIQSNNLIPVKDRIRPKLKAFGEDWAGSFADKDSGAKDLRAQDHDFDLTIFN